MSHTAYRGSGVDTDEAEAGLRRLVGRIARNWPPPSACGAVQLDIGYFANVVDVGGMGLAISTDGVGSKAMIARMMERYDTIGIGCVAVNVNDLICVGARPVSLVDYIVVERVEVHRHRLKAWVIGAVVEDRTKGVEIAQPRLIGHGTRFRAP